MSDEVGAGFFSKTDSKLERRVASFISLLLKLGAGVTILLMLITVVHGIGRYAFNRPVPGLVEMSGFMQVTLASLFIAYTQMVKGHITVGVFVDRLSTKYQSINDTIIYILCLIFACIALWYSTAEGISMMSAVNVNASPVLEIPLYPFQFIVAFGWATFGLSVALHLVHFIAAVVKK